MTKNLATTLSFLTAPLVAAIALIVIGAIKNGDDLLDITALSWGIITYCYTLGVTLIIGLPVYLILKRFNIVSWWSAILTGSFSGAMTLFIFDALNPLVIAIGGLSGLVFWLVWRKGQ
jgi:hypothetical protein